MAERMDGEAGRLAAWRRQPTAAGRARLPARPFPLEAVMGSQLRTSNVMITRDRLAGSEATRQRRDAPASDAPTAQHAICSSRAGPARLTTTTTATTAMMMLMMLLLLLPPLSNLSLHAAAPIRRCRCKVLLTPPPFPLLHSGPKLHSRKSCTAVDAVRLGQRCSLHTCRHRSRGGHERCRQ